MSDQLDLFGDVFSEPRKRSRPSKPRLPRKAAPTGSRLCSLFLSAIPDHLAKVRSDDIGTTFLKECRVYGKMQPPAKLHVTLLGFRFDLNMLPENELAAFILAMGRAAQAIVPCTPRFEIAFDRLVRFGGGQGMRPFVLTQAKEANKDLHRLHDALVEEDRAVFDRMRESKYTPHMTVLRTKHETPGVPAGPVSWMAHEIALILNEHGSGEYQVLGRWFLKD
jgi:2'-5' RNA ligase